MTAPISGPMALARPLVAPDGDPAAVLYAAAYLIEVWGWAQGDYQDRRGALDLAGAVRLACLGTPSGSLDGHPAAQRALDAVREVVGDPFLNLWNDHADRTANDVLAAMRRAAADLLAAR